MKYRPMQLFCACGGSPARIDDVGFTTNRELVVHWWCARCKKAAYVVKTLADCWRDCPSSDFLLTEKPHPGKSAEPVNDFKAEDLKFLRSLRVRLPDDVEC